MRRTGGKASRQAQDELTALLESVRVELAAARADGSATVAMLRRELRAREAERAALLDAVVRLAGSMAALAPGAATGNGAHSMSGVIGGSVMPDQSMITIARDDDFLDQEDEDEIVLDESSSAAVAATIEAAVGLTGAIDGSATETGSTVRATVAVEAPPNGVATNGSSTHGGTNGTATNGASANGASANGGSTSESSTDSGLGGTAGVAPESSSRPAGHGAVEVRCRFGDKWVDGFEICEIVRNGGRVRYRLRRLLDGCILPELFNAADVRCFDAPLKDS